MYNILPSPFSSNFHLYPHCRKASQNQGVVWPRCETQVVGGSTGDFPAGVPIPGAAIVVANGFPPLLLHWRHHKPLPHAGSVIIYPVFVFVVCLQLLPILVPLPSNPPFPQHLTKQVQISPLPALPSPSTLMHLRSNLQSTKIEC